LKKGIINTDIAEELYFIAIIPSQQVYNEVWQLKNYFREKYQSKASLNSPPHITLHMPFQWKEQKLEKLIEGLTEFAASQQTAEIRLKDFNAFPPRVIYMQVEKNSWLENLQRDLKKFCRQKLNLFNADYRDIPFHPHVTLAFRDLKKSNFLKAWEEFRQRKYEETFLVNEIVLLKHNKKVWEVFKRFSLKTNS